MDDSLLVQRSGAGEVDAFEHLYDRYAGRIHDTLWWTLGDRSAADEALKRTFMVAGARIHQAPLAGETFTWLMAIARREGLGRRARVGSAGAGPATGWQGPGGDGEPGSELLSDAADLLSAEDRLAFDLGFRQALGPAAVAAVMGTSPALARSAVQRARHNAAEALGLAMLTAEGSGYCTGLTMIVPTVAPRLDAGLARRLRRHAQECARCRSVISSADPEILLRRAPAFARPPEVRSEVMASVALASHRGTAWPARTGGYPPGGGHPRPLALAGVGAVTAVGLVIVVSLLMDQPDLLDTRVSAGGSTTTSAAPTTSTTEPGAPEDSSTSSTGPVPDTTAVPVASPTAPKTTSPKTTSPKTTSPKTTTPKAPAPTAAPSTTTTTTLPPDETGPVLSGLSLSTPVLRVREECTRTEFPTSVTVTVTAVDERSGIGSVTAQVIPYGTGVVTMSPAGGNSFTATLSVSLPTAVEPDSVEVFVTATDTVGNTSLERPGLTLVCDRP